MNKLMYSVTDEKAKALRDELTNMGVVGARIRKMPNGACRLVLKYREDRDAARDALVMVNACTACGDAFTSPSSRNAWNGYTEIFVRFLTP